MLKNAVLAFFSSPAARRNWRQAPWLSADGAWPGRAIPGQEGNAINQRFPDFSKDLASPKARA